MTNQIPAQIIAEALQDIVNKDIPSFTPNSMEVQKRRYLSKKSDGDIESPDEMFWRVADNLSKAEDKYDGDSLKRRSDFYKLMRSLRFLPNSPTLMNAGRELQQLSACFVLPVEDSLDSIFERVKQTALIHKSGGGTGFAFSRLRPANDTVGSTGGVASGPVSFIRAFDVATDVVKQGGTRRGANMGVLSVSHPDIVQFIESKADGSSLNNFNISVGVDDAFMRAVKQNRTFKLYNPHSSKCVGELDAKEVFDRLTEMAHQTGDPGLIFLDAINRENPNPSLGKIESTNPCFVGSMRLATDKGLLTFDELYVEQTNISVLTDSRVTSFANMILGGNGQVTVQDESRTILREAVPVFKTRSNWPVFKLEMESGLEVIATEDHKFYTPNGIKALHELEDGDEVLIQSGSGVWNTDDTLPPFFPEDKFKARVERGEANLPKKWSRELGELLGWIIGDGWVSSEMPKGRNVPNWTIGLTFGDKEKQELAPKFRALVKEWVGLDGTVVERHNAMSVSYKSALYYFLASLGLKDVNGPEKQVPDAIWSAPKEAVMGFLSALFSADGTIVRSDEHSTCSIRLSSSSKKLLQQVQLLLLNTGIVSRIRMCHEAGQKMMPDSKRQLKAYNVSKQYELLIHSSGRAKFMSEVGFLIDAKQNKALEWMSNHHQQGKHTYTDCVKTIEYQGNEDVYCTTEPETNSLTVNGIVVSNCGEQPLLPYESCNLGSINLAQHTMYEDGVFVVNWAKLQKTVDLSVRFLDNVIDMNAYPIPEIAEMTRKTRRIGLGVMGFADMLVQMGVSYNSQEAVDIGQEVMERIWEYTHIASRNLAQERGSYPAWNTSTYDVEIRNTAPTTIAPTGTISIIAGVSSGIEPLFALAYTRNVMDKTRLIEVHPYFEAIIRHLGMYSEELLNRIAESGSIPADVDVPQWVRDVFVSSHDISHEHHINMQAAFQKWTDNAVSKTINLPHNSTVQDIRDAYWLAYETGCKGITVYRDGSKQEQVLTVGQSNSESAQGNEIVNERKQPRTRSRVVSGRTECIESGHGKLYITINNDDEGNPFEVFGNLGKAGSCNSAMMEAIGRMVTLCLRSGVDTEAIVRQLEGISCCPHWTDGVLVKSVPDAMSKVLAKDIKGGVKEIEKPIIALNEPLKEVKIPKVEGSCPECHTVLSYESGCAVCYNCLWAKCD